MLKRGGIGSASIALIFVVLCMTIFTAISFVFALSEEALIKNEVDLVMAYYAADTLAEQVLAEIISVAVLPGSVMGVEIFTRRDTSLMAEVIYFTIPITDNNELHVAVSLDGNGYNIISWRMFPIGMWEADGTINIWQGDADDGFLLLEDGE